MPTWRRFPRWLPGPLRISVLACWGHPGYPNLGATRDPCRPAEEIRIRLVEDSEYIFRSLPRRGMQYESVFHVSSRNGVSRLRWEFGYRTRRPADVIGRAVVMASVRRSMSQTLDDISRNIPARQAFQASRRAYPSRAGHLPAA
jgi:hypothetical protein